MTYREWMDAVKKLVGQERWGRHYLLLRDLYYQGESVKRAAEWLLGKPLD